MFNRRPVDIFSRVLMQAALQVIAIGQMNLIKKREGADHPIGVSIPTYNPLQPRTYVDRKYQPRSCFRPHIGKKQISRAAWYRKQMQVQP